MSLELSPGFFDARMAMSDDDDDIIPQNIDVENLEENKPTKIVFVEFINLMFVNQKKKDCGCGSGGWSRTKTY